MPKSTDEINEKKNCSMIEVPFELPSEIPNSHQIEYTKTEDPDNPLANRSRLTIHVEVSRASIRDGARRYSNVDIWTEGYNNPSGVFSDVLDELKFHDEKIKQTLFQQVPEVQNLNLQRNKGSRLNIQESTKDCDEPRTSFKENDISLVSDASLVNESVIRPNQSTPNDSFLIESPRELLSPVVSEIPTLRKVNQLKSSKKKYKSKEVTCYSIDQEAYQGFVFKHSPKKGSYIFTGEEALPTKILNPKECGVVMIKILPENQVKIRVIR